jgi:type IV pilus assembly protein PilA
MLRKLRERAQEEQGFTLIELLVVILIIGILAAIAIPSFINQRSKGTDAEAKSAARTMQTAMETCATDRDGSYDEGNCGTTALEGIEPSLNDAADVEVVALQTDADEFQVAASAARGTNNADNDTSNDDMRYLIKRTSTGTTTKTCVRSADTVDAGGCRDLGAGDNSGTW